MMGPILRHIGEQTVIMAGLDPLAANGVMTGLMEHITECVLDTPRPRSNRRAGLQPQHAWNVKWRWATVTKTWRRRLFLERLLL
jgi:hypothetical protein